MLIYQVTLSCMILWTPFYNTRKEYYKKESKNSIENHSPKNTFKDLRYNTKVKTITANLLHFFVFIAVS